MKFVTALIVLVAILTACGSQARAVDEDFSNGNLLMRLFETVCVPNIGRPDKVRAFVSDQKFPEITKPTLVTAFVGEGTKGGAWEVFGLPSPQRFSVSIRGTSEACAVWAEQADQKYVLDAFAKLMEGSKRPGLDVKKDREMTQDTQFGIGKVVMYKMYSTTNGKAVVFTVITGEKPGGLFQAGLQVVPVAP